MSWTPNPNHGKFVLPEGYRDLGWQLGLDNPDRKKCHESGHSMKDGQVREFDNSLYLHRCTDVVTICDACKTVYHTDMSD